MGTMLGTPASRVAGVILGSPISCPSTWNMVVLLLAAWFHSLLLEYSVKRQTHALGQIIFGAVAFD